VNSKPGSILLEPENQTVFGEGSYTLSATESKNEGLVIAERLAKYDASKKISEYFEVVTVSGEDGTPKEYMASVSASNMKYETVDEVTTVDGESIKITVRVKATYNPVELERSIDRFLNNEDLKKDVSELRAKIDSLEGVLQEKNTITEKLRSANKSLKEDINYGTAAYEEARLKIQNLENELRLKRLELASGSSMVVEAIAKLKHESTDVNLTQVTNSMNSGFENKYVEALHEFISKVNTRVKVNVRADNSKSDVVVSPIVSIAMSNKTASIPFEVFEEDFKPGRYGDDKGAFRFYSSAIGSNFESSVIASYIVNFVLEFNGSKKKIPILATVSKKNGVAERSDDFCRKGSMRSNIQHVTRLCVMYWFDDMQIGNRREFISEGAYNGDLNFRLEKDIRSDYDIKSYFEIAKKVTKDESK
tara:strand:- start:31778 stop:33037 length:1260 start_codon:yes stop_codon:yes gene_type:complete